MLRNNYTQKINVFKAVGVTICFFLGLFGFFLCVWRRNWNAATASLILELISVTILRFNGYYYKNQLLEKTNIHVISALKIISVIMCILLLAGGVSDIYLGYKHEQSFHMENDGYYFSAIPTFLGSICAFVLFWDCKKFQSIFETPNFQLQNI